MAIIFKNAPITLGEEATDYVKANARLFCKEAGIPTETPIEIGFNETKIKHIHGTTILKIGVADLKNDLEKVGAAAADIRKLFQGNYSAGPSVYKTQPKALDNATNLDEESWIEQVAAEYFPSAVSLCNADKMYQLVTGTSGGSIYRCIFLGPNLRGAARVKGKTISFRFTTTFDMKPDGDAALCLERLGGNHKYADRITCHAECSGPYSENPEEFRMIFGAYYGALRPFLTSPFPAIIKLAEGTA